MHWSAYEVFSIISGLSLVGVGLLPETADKDRYWSMAGGAALIGYAFFVASRDSGTYYFPAAIFFIPVLVAIVQGAKAWDRRSRRAAPAEEDER